MKIGITTTVPSEIVIAGGHTLIDLNNVFVASPQNGINYVELAEQDGYPRNTCSWIKGLYSIVVKGKKELINVTSDLRESLKIDAVITVTQGDCSNTHALRETYQLAGVETISFAYMEDKDYNLFKNELDKLIRYFKTDWDQVKLVKKKLDHIRTKVAEIDRLTYEENKVSGFDNHLFQVSCSDYNSNLEQFEKDIDEFLEKAKTADVIEDEIRLGYIGVPPIFNNIYNYLDNSGARVVFNEVQRQFAMPFAIDTDDLVLQYQKYTYPYGVFDRIKDIEQEIEKRNIKGIIHYVQSFCFRQIEDLIFRKKLKIPILTLEGDKPGPLDARTKLRIDSFLEMLKD